MNTLLIVDDEPAFGEFVLRVANAVGYSATATVNPTVFLDDLRHGPDVVMIDLQMPGIDGIELLRELASRRVTSKVVVASGMDARTMDTVQRLGRELGLDMVATVGKPVRATELKALLNGLKRQVFEPTVPLLQRAIDEGELFPVFQPKIAVTSGKCVGAEMLVRWRGANGVVIGPGEFVPFAERSGLIDALTDWVLAQGIAQAGEWRRAGLDLKLAMNVSATNLQDTTLPDRIDTLCRQAGLPPAKLVIELTETATMRDAARLMEVLARLRLKGVDLSIDDFGTGYSSLVQLHRLPFTELKIDQSFVTSMDREGEVIARAITQLGHALGLTVTAEGVETQHALDMLGSFGVDLAQGYLLSRPIPAADLPAFMQSRNG